MEVILLDKQDYNNLVNEIAELKNLVLSSVTSLKNISINNDSDELPFGLEYIPLPQLYNQLDWNYFKWYRNYSKVIQYKKYGKDIYVHLPSLHKWLASKNINK